MRLLAISDLHVGHPANWKALTEIQPAREDLLLLGGDVGETTEQLQEVFELLVPKFKQLFWVPGNHELWTMPRDLTPARGDAKYQELIGLCRRHGVLTPEDPFYTFSHGGKTYSIVPTFVLYDYSFRPENVELEDAIGWAADSGVVCADEHLLHPDPFPSRQAWCESRVSITRARLEQVPKSHKLIILNHYPLRREFAQTPKVPRFSLWCGTTQTENWHKEFNVEVVIYGHLHFPGTFWRDGVRFEEVSFGYPRERPSGWDVNKFVREIMSTGLK